MRREEYIDMEVGENLTRLQNEHSTIFYSLYRKGPGDIFFYENVYEVRKMLVEGIIKEDYFITCFAWKTVKPKHLMHIL